MWPELFATKAMNYDGPHWAAFTTSAKFVSEARVFSCKDWSLPRRSPRHSRSALSVSNSWTVHSMDTKAVCCELAGPPVSRVSALHTEQSACNNLLADFVAGRSLGHASFVRGSYQSLTQYAWKANSTWQSTRLRRLLQVHSKTESKNG